MGDLVSSVLDTDAVDGLQLSVESCSVSWVKSGADYTLTAGTERPFYAGPIVVEGTALSSVRPASRRAPLTTCS